MDERCEFGDTLTFIVCDLTQCRGGLGQHRCGTFEGLDQTLSPWQVGGVLLNGLAQGNHRVWPITYGDEVLCAAIVDVWIPWVELGHRCADGKPLLTRRDQSQRCHGERGVRRPT